MLDRSPTERLIMAALLKGGPATSAALIERLDVSDSTAVTAVIAQLVADGALLESNGVISVVHRRVVKPGARAILDRLGDL
ncbi:unannotated protein [freshwater metagenome]|uniref:Unannotated protein n=1 Tax=freshwater metagenome TaxID=449393 RepID=A0A6J7DIZ4_9ZZZZ